LADAAHRQGVVKNSRIAIFFIPSDFAACEASARHGGCRALYAVPKGRLPPETTFAEARSRKEEGLAGRSREHAELSRSKSQSFHVPTHIDRDVSY
jgi:hypothetical protein